MKSLFFPWHFSCMKKIGCVLQKEIEVIHLKVFVPKWFLAVQNSSIGDLVTQSLTHWLTVLYWLTYKERPKRLMTFETFDWSDEETWTDQKKTMIGTKTKTKTMTETNTFREHLQRAILDTFDLWDIWSEWWRDMNWPKKDNNKDNYKDKDNDRDKYI